MFDFLDRIYIMIACTAKSFFKDEDGAVDLVTIVVLIGVAVVLAIVFRKQAKDLIEKLFSDIGTNADKAIKPE